MKYEDILNYKVIDDEVNRNFLQKYLLAYDNITDIAIEYNLQDGITLENISYKIYGNSEYEWIIMLVNKIYNRFNDLPLNTNQLIHYVMNKYGSDNLYETHHYEDSKGNITQNTNDNAITNFEYEQTLNDRKRKIYVPTLDFLNKFKVIVNQNRINRI